MRFYYELAEKLGMTVGELLEKVTSSELVYWMALWKVRNAEAKHAQNRRR